MSIEAIHRAEPGRQRQGTRTRRLSGQRAPNSAERVATELTEAIRRGELAAGEQVNQQRWAERLDVSRAVLREGLKVVATQSLLHHDPNRGYFVSTMSIQQVSQLYWLRVNVEREVLLSIRRPNEVEFDHIREAGERAIAGSVHKDPMEMLDAEREMFFDIYALSPFDFLATEAARLWDLAQLFRLTVVRERMSDLHPTPSLYGDRKRAQMLAVEQHDPYGLTESVVLERRAVADRFLKNEFHWHAGGSVALVVPDA